MILEFIFEMFLKTLPIISCVLAAQLVVKIKNKNKKSP